MPLLSANVLTFNAITGVRLISFQLLNAPERHINFGFMPKWRL